MDAETKPTTQQELYVVLEGGLVREVAGVPDGFHVTVLDYDIEEETDRDRIEISPLDGEACCITRF